MRIWERVQKVAMKRDGLSEAPKSVEMQKRYSFEEIKIIPQEWRRDLLSLIAGTDDPRAQKFMNEILPVKVLIFPLHNRKSLIERIKI